MGEGSRAPAGFHSARLTLPSRTAAAFRRESRSPANGGGPELGSLAPHGDRGCHRGSHSSRSGRIRPCRQAAQEGDAGSWRSVRDPLPRSAREARTPTPRGSRLAPWRGCREASRGSLAASHRVGRPGRREPPPLAKPSGPVGGGPRPWTRGGNGGRPGRAGRGSMNPATMAAVDSSHTRSGREVAPSANRPARPRYPPHRAARHRSENNSGRSAVVAVRDSGREQTASAS